MHQTPGKVLVIWTGEMAQWVTHLVHGHTHTHKKCNKKMLTISKNSPVTSLVGAGNPENG